MPRYDKTGPLGTGPIGRGMGPCGGGQAAGWGRGRGFRHGGGRGPGWMSNPYSSEDERQSLEQQKGWLEEQITVITQRLNSLGKTD